MTGGVGADSGTVAACSAASLAADEPTAGTAAVARSWLAVEQPGPWGRSALTESGLDRGVGRALDIGSAGTGVRVVLVRQPGRPADDRPGRRRVLAASTAPGVTWLAERLVEDVGELAALDLARLGQGEVPPGFRLRERSAYLVCTNGRRDRCCALAGRPLAAALAGTVPEEVWEVSHLGGHRFAPTSLLLPHGYSHARLTEPLAREVLAAAAGGRVALPGLRGRSTWERPGQAVEVALRERHGLVGLDDLRDVRVEPGGERGTWTTTVTAGDGRAWRAGVRSVEHPAARPESCGAVALPVESFALDALVPA